MIDELKKKKKKRVNAGDLDDDQVESGPRKRLQRFAFMLGWRSPHLEREGNTD